jgi:hypothetical protein
MIGQKMWDKGPLLAFEVGPYHPGGLLVLLHQTNQEIIGPHVMEFLVSFIRVGS